MVTTSPIITCVFSFTKCLRSVIGVYKNLARVSFARLPPKLLRLRLIGDVLGRPPMSGDCFTGAVSGRTRTVGVLSKEDGVKR